MKRSYQLKANWLSGLVLLTLLFPSMADAKIREALLEVEMPNVVIVPTADEINRQGDFNNSVRTVFDMGSTNFPDRFGGVSVEGESVVIYVTQLLNSAEESLITSDLQKTIPVKFKQVKYTAQNLDDVVRQISSMQNELVSAGAKLVSVGVSDLENIVIVTVLEGQGDIARQILSPKFGDQVSIIEGPPMENVGRSDSPGLYKAGLEILIDHSPTAHTLCTSGFFVKAWDGAPAAITAGHCGAQGQVVNHGGTRIGEISVSQFSNDIDGAGFRLDVGQSSNWLFRESAWLEPINNFSTASNGAAVCAEGRTSLHRCGTVFKRNTTVIFQDGQTLVNQDCASFGSQKGDSGGPIYQFGTGIGISSAADTNQTCYTPVQRIASWLGASPYAGPFPKSLTVDLNGMCLDADIAGGTGNGQEIQQWTCLTPGVSNRNQAFYVEPQYLGNGRWSEIYSIKAAHNGRCVDYDGNNMGNGGRVQQWDCDFVPINNRRFSFMRGAGLSIALKNAQNYRCVDMDANNNRYLVGNRAQQWDCNMNQWQRFTLIDRPVL